MLDEIKRPDTYHSAKVSGDDPVWDDQMEVVQPHYQVNEVPPFGETILYAWQHTLVDVSPFVLPILVANAVGYTTGQAAYMISACLVWMGMFTFINTTWGNRLPSVLGPSATDCGAMATAGMIFGAPAMWMAGLVGGVFEIVVGASGVLVPLRRFLPPYVCGIIVLTIGVSLARVAGGWVFTEPSAPVFTLAALTVVSILAMTVLGHRLKIGLLTRGAILFSLLLFGVGGASLLGVANFAALSAAPWVGVPRLFPFGGPGFGWELAWGAVAGVTVGYVGSISESIGDYAATCAVAGVAYRVRHIRAGITVEGIASALGTLVGALPLTTYAQNIGVIATTGVASRRVIQVAAGLLILYGLSPKCGALLLLIPRPIVGAVFMLICGMIATAGLKLLAFGERDEVQVLTTAFTLIAALTIPLAAPQVEDWFAALPPSAKLFLSNSVVIATCLGIGLNASLRALLPRAPAPTPRRH